MVSRTPGRFGRPRARQRWRLGSGLPHRHFLLCRTRDLRAAGHARWRACRLAV